MTDRHTYKPTWQDRDLRFDASLSDLRLRLGEFEIDSINSVEDSKGNNGDRGFLVITNLRLMWVSHKRPRTNLSVGLNSIVKLSIKTANSRLRGSIQACKLGGTRAHDPTSATFKNCQGLKQHPSTSTTLTRGRLFFFFVFFFLFPCAKCSSCANSKHRGTSSSLLRWSGNHPGSSPRHKPSFVPMKPPGCIGI